MASEWNLEERDDDWLKGWAVSDGDRAGAPDSILLRAGAVVLGQVRRTVARADVDAAYGAPGVVKGFLAPVGALLLLARLVRDAPAPVLAFADREAPLLALPGALSDAARARALRLCDEEAAPLRVTDLWYATTHLLKLRLEGAIEAPLSLRCYQPRPAGAEPAGLDLVGDLVLSPAGLTVAEVPLRDPYAPLLIVVLDAEDALLQVDLLPFPSLCRGGAHAAELAARSRSRHPIADLQLLSDALLWEHAGWHEAEPRAVGRIAVDLRGATGHETILRPAFRAWLSAVFDLSLEVPAPEGAAPAEAALHADVAARLAAGRPGGASGALVLTLPARAIPTIAALASRRLGAAIAGGARLGPFLTVDPESGRPGAFVSLPALDPAALPAAWACPVLLSRPGAAEAPAGPAAVAEALAILPGAPGAPADDRRLYPTAPDAPLPLPGLAALEGQGISVVVPVHNGLARLDRLLLSLAAQSCAGDVEVILVDSRSHPHLPPQIRALAESRFPDRARLARYDRPHNQSAEYNLGASLAEGRYLLFAEPSLVLHDRRTLAALRGLAALDRVASAACLLLATPAGPSGELAFRSGGYFPSRIDFLGAPFLSLAEADCEAALPLATYPVVANSAALCMVAAETFRHLGGFDARACPNHGHDVAYGLRAGAAGYRSLCTTLVTAVQEERRGRPREVEVPRVALGDAAALLGLLAAATVVRAL
ncbi:hypothetical protein OPKNFCMD_3369 [Methylobacterium crusticola]|uniref:Glycosyltransferase 2-like domain-containing protein n=1 Tax=Methylobacterium crusticola TaxID=1697972 RepID=A0ABQ4QZ21_9HYPH|nr:hypothetical protein OPKNFCMD_3369 [Methylobacterium crusticola]